MKNIKAFEEALKNKNQQGLNRTLLRAYMDSMEFGDDLLTFHGSIWNDQIPKIAKQLDENGVTEIAISDTSSGLINELDDFEECGFKVVGLVKVIGDCFDWDTGKRMLVAAVKLVKA